jgi:hypothetical protein
MKRSLLIMVPLLCLAVVIGIVTMFATTSSSPAKVHLSKTASVPSGPITNDPTVGEQVAAGGHGMWAIESNPVNITSNGVYVFTVPVPVGKVLPPQPQITSSKLAAPDPASIVLENDVYKACGIDPAADPNYQPMHLTTSANNTQTLTVQLNCRDVTQSLLDTTLWVEFN